MMIEPLGSRVLVEPRENEKETASGILLVKKVEETQQIGTVIAVGTGHVLDDGTRLPVYVKVGDTVMFAKYAGTQINDDGYKYLMLEERDLIARISKVDKEKLN